MGRDLRIEYSNGNTCDFDGISLNIIEDFFQATWPKWYENQYKKNNNFIFNHILKIDRNTLKKLYNYIYEDNYPVELKNYRKEYLLNKLSYILNNTSKKDKVIFDFW